MGFARLQGDHENGMEAQQLKWILYSISAVATLLGIAMISGAAAIFQETAGLILLLIGTMSFGFGAVVGKLDKLAKKTD